MKTILGDITRLNRIGRGTQKVYILLNKIPFLPSFNQYNITVSNEKKFVWFRIAKVGTRTILNYLRETGISLDVEHPYCIYYAPRIYQNYYKFAFVRNPWDRLVSCWLDKVLRANYFRFDDLQLKEMKEFEKFVEFVSQFDLEKCDPHLRLQSALIDINNLDYLGRLETFNKDFEFLCDRLEMPKKNVVSRNVSPTNKSPKNYYNSDLIEKVYQLYKKDIQIFGYQYHVSSL